MALEDLTPAVRVESILNGDEITPANRLEYFLQKAATELPKVAAADAGKVLAVNASGEWAVGQKIFYHIYDDGEGVSNLTPEQAYELFTTGVQIVAYGGYIDPDDTTTVSAGRKEYGQLFYDAGVYKLSAGADTLVADTFTSPFHVD